MIGHWFIGTDTLCAVLHPKKGEKEVKPGKSRSVFFLLLVLQLCPVLYSKHWFPHTHRCMMGARLAAEPQDEQDVSGPTCRKLFAAAFRAETSGRRAKREMKMRNWCGEDSARLGNKRRSSRKVTFRLLFLIRPL